MLFNDLPDYLAWANTCAAEMAAQTPGEEARGILAHILAVETLWADRIGGQPPSCPQRPDWDLPHCQALIPSNAAHYRDLIASRQAGEIIRYRNTRGEEFESSVSDILLHIFAHGAYHRGQISQIVRSAGGEITDTDYILFKRQ